MAVTPTEAIEIILLCRKAAQRHLFSVLYCSQKQSRSCLVHASVRVVCYVASTLFTRKNLISGSTAHRKYDQRF